MAASSMQHPGQPSTAEQDPEYQVGVKYIKTKEYALASETLSCVLERFVEEYGELAPECADVYMQYGLALLREVEEREENANDVFGDCVPREIATGAAPEGQAPEGEGTSSKNAADGESKEGGADAGEDGGEEEEGDEEGEDEAPDGQHDEGEEGSKAAGKAPAEEGDEGGPPADASADDAADDLQIAFEVLESARIIMEKEDDDAEKLGDVHGYLGDVNLRNEQFDQALADYTSCLKIREATCRKDDRLLIEVHHQIAMVYSLVGGQKESALAALRKAVDSCETRLKNLRAMLKGEDAVIGPPAGSSLKAMTKPQIEAEIIEVEEIAEEFRGRIEAEEVPNGLDEGSSSSAAGASSAVAGAASSLGLDAVKALAAQSGLMAAPAAADSRKGFVNQGFAGVPDAAPVKTLTVVSKKKKAEAAVAMTKVEGKRSAEVADAGGAQGQGAEKKAKVAVDGGDASAAPTPARLDALGVA